MIAFEKLDEYLAYRIDLLGDKRRFNEAKEIAYIREYIKSELLSEEKKK